MGGCPSARSMMAWSEGPLGFRRVLVNVATQTDSEASSAAKSSAGVRSTVPTKLARQQIASSRCKAKASFRLAVEDIRRRGCAASACVRLAGEASSGIWPRGEQGRHPRSLPVKPGRAVRLRAEVDLHDRAVRPDAGEHRVRVAYVPGELGELPPSGRSCPQENRTAQASRPLHSRSSQARHRAFARIIWCGVRQDTRIRSGLATMTAIALAREVATFSRCRS